MWYGVSVLCSHTRVYWNCQVWGVCGMVSLYFVATRESTGTVRCGCMWYGVSVLCSHTRVYWNCQVWGVCSMVYLYFVATRESTGTVRCGVYVVWCICTL